MKFSPLLTTALFLLAACAQEKKPDHLEAAPVSYSSLPGWAESTTLGGAVVALQRSCEKFSLLPQTYAVNASLGVNGGNVQDWSGACAAAESVQPGEERSFFERNFTPYRITNNGAPEGRFTGYYAIELKGSRKRTTIYRYPLYKRPPNLEGYRDRPFFSREEIDHGALRGQGLELLYVSDPVDLYFLHVQGSGRVRLEDGSVVRVNYAGQNGREYISIGRTLAEDGELVLEDITAPSLKAWLRSHPEQAEEVMERNPSYVFFRIQEGEGPIGGQEVPLTPEHSLAVDTRYIPYGTPLWLDTTLPADKNGSERAYQRLLIAQDTGGAIKGPIRGDIFFGHGKRAETLAGDMKQPGNYYALLPVKAARE